MQEQMRLVEQERDALRTFAKNEEIARIAAEGRLPLPASPQDDEFASPKKERKSLDAVTVLSSVASEEELGDLKMRLEWEKQKASRALDQVEFLQAECRFNCCASRASRNAASQKPTTSDEPAEKIKIGRFSTVFIPAEGIN